MSCNSNGSCHCQKSIARFYNKTTQAFPANTVTPISVNANQVVLEGKAIVPTLNGYRIEKTGLYNISCDVVLLGATAGNVILQAYLDGVAMPCTERTVTLVAEAYTTIHLETDILFEPVCRCQNNTSHAITFAVVSTGGAGSIVNVCSGVKKH